MLCVHVGGPEGTTTSSALRSLPRSPKRRRGDGGQDLLDPVRRGALRQTRSFEDAPPKPLRSELFSRGNVEQAAIDSWQPSERDSTCFSEVTRPDDKHNKPTEGFGVPKMSVGIFDDDDDHDQDDSLMEAVPDTYRRSTATLRSTMSTSFDDESAHTDPYASRTSTLERSDDSSLHQHPSIPGLMYKQESEQINRRKSPRKRRSRGGRLKNTVGPGNDNKGETLEPSEEAPMAVVDADNVDHVQAEEEQDEDERKHTEKPSKHVAIADTDNDDCRDVKWQEAETGSKPHTPNIKRRRSKGSKKSKKSGAGGNIVPKRESREFR